VREDLGCSLVLIGGVCALTATPAAFALRSSTC
jgi:hypothetical protein